jgi:hypothetical protein
VFSWLQKNMAIYVIVFNITFYLNEPCEIYNVADKSCMISFKKIVNLFSKAT